MLKSVPLSNGAISFIGKGHCSQSDGNTYRCVIVDVETTGGSQEDTVIECACREVHYTKSDGIVDIQHLHQSFHQPPLNVIPAYISEQTGITSDMTLNQHIKSSKVWDVIGRADVLLGHGASFDCRFLSRLCPSIQNKRWACSVLDADWRKVSSDASLTSLLKAAGYRYDAHRAGGDVNALTWLMMLYPEQFLSILTRARRFYGPSVLWVTSMPFHLNAYLKSRGLCYTDRHPEFGKCFYITGTYGAMRKLGNEITSQDELCRVIVSSNEGIRFF